MALDFPSSPTNGQVYGNHYYSSAKGAWKSILPAATPSQFTNATFTDVTVNSSTTTNTPIKVNGVLGQTANLQEWKDSVGTVLASVLSTGAIKTPLVGSVFSGKAYLETAGDTNGINVVTNSAANKGIVVKSSASQTANLQEWQSSTGSVLAKVDSSGNITTPALTLTTQLAPQYGGMPAGAITQFAGATAPSGYLICNGATFSSSTYPELAAVLGDTYGVHSGTTYYLPNLQGKVPVGKDSGTFTALGATGGAETVTLTAAQSGVPAHSHANTATVSITGGAHTHQLPMAASGAPNSVGDIPLRASGGADGNFRTSFEASASNYGSSTGTHTHSGTVTMSNVNNTAANASQAHTNLQPYVVLNYIIKT